MGKQSRPPGCTPSLGRLTYSYYDRPGFALSFSVTAYPDRYLITLWWNGARCRRIARRSLAGALSWATRAADQLLRQFGMPPKQIALGDLLSDVKARLAA